MIIIIHILGHGGILDNLEENTSKENMVRFLQVICNSAVNVYAMISGICKD